MKIDELLCALDFFLCGWQCNGARYVLYFKNASHVFLNDLFSLFIRLSVVPTSIFSSQSTTFCTLYFRYINIQDSYTNIPIVCIHRCYAWFRLITLGSPSLLQWIQRQYPIQVTRYSSATPQKPCRQLHHRRVNLSDMWLGPVRKRKLSRLVV